MGSLRRRWLQLALPCCLTLGCGSDPNPEDVGKSCVVGTHVECVCPDKATGVQVCNPDGRSYGPCTGCAAGTGATGGGSATGGSAGGCPACPYVLADCIQSPSNGSEVCDDEGWSVPSPGKPLVLVCLNDAGGTIYVSENTGPQMSDGVSRCQGWETTGQNAWDHLSYIQKLTCDAEQKSVGVDLSGYVGQTVYVGAHDAPAGGGHDTQSCFAWKK